MDLTETLESKKMAFIIDESSNKLIDSVSAINRIWEFDKKFQDSRIEKKSLIINYIQLLNQENAS